MRAGSSLRNSLVTRAFSLLSSSGRSYGRLSPSRISVMPKPRRSPTSKLMKKTEKESIVRIVNILRVEEDQELLTSILRVVRLLSSKARAFKRLLVENEGLSILLQHAARLTVGS